MPKAPNSATLPRVLGDHIRQARTAANLTQDEVAAGMRTYGLRWDRSIVTKVERGSRSTDLPELVLLCLVLSVGLPRLLPEDGSVALTSSCEIASVALQRLLSSALPEPVTSSELRSPALGPKAMEAAIDRLTASASQNKPLLEQAWGGRVPFADLRAAAEDQTSDAVRHAASSLGLDPLVVALISRQKWGHSLRAEREARLEIENPPLDVPAYIKGASVGGESRSDRAIRGHITRALMAEIREYAEAVGLEVEQ